LAFCALLSSQGVKPVVRIAAFSGDALTRSELATLEKLVAGYIVEMQAFRVVDDKGQDLALREAETTLANGGVVVIDPIAADFIVSGDVSKLGDELVITLETIKVKTGEKKTVTERVASLNDLVLTLRALTRRLFERQNDATSSSSGSGTVNMSASSAMVDRASIPTLDSFTLKDVSGLWISDNDRIVESITILPSGYSVITTTVGKQIQAKASVKGGMLTLAQTSSNNPEIYYLFFPISKAEAKQLAAQARPWKWLLRLSKDKLTLIGDMESVRIGRDESGVLSIDNAYSREAWFSKKR
jgi:hypothetical protein